jgi:protease-4
MRQFLITVAGVFVGLALFLVGVPLIFIASAAATSATPVAAHTVLTLDLRGGLTDQSAPSVFGLGRRASVMSVVEALHAAENDSRIRGLFVRLPEGGMTPAAADELRGAFQRFRRAGKTIVVYSQGLYAGGAVTSTYELAASASEIWMQPSSSFQVTGLATEEIFFRRLFDRFGVVPEFEQRAEYKNAVNPFLYSDFTAPHREAELSWMTSVYTSAIQAAAVDRHQDPAALRRTLEAGPYSAEDAMTRRLIDHVGQEHDAEQSILASGAAAGPKTHISPQ